MARILITSRHNLNEYFLVDNEMAQELSMYIWYKLRSGYVYRVDNHSIVYVHRMVTIAQKGMLVDHINHNKLDNRRENLRVVYSTQNCQNRLPRKNGTSRYKGVSWNKQNQCWLARIQVAGKPLFLGVFDSELVAARAYDEAAAFHFGKHSLLNSV